MRYFMGKVTRGTLLATLKELKKHKRPKPVVTAVAVQAICGGDVQSNKAADLKAVVERRRAMVEARPKKVVMQQREDLAVFENDFAAFMASYRDKA